MIVLAIQQETQKGFFQEIGGRFEDGGFTIMMLILIMGIIGLALLVKGIWLAKNQDPKIHRNITLINSLGLFALVLGVFGQLLHLINTLDYLSSFEGTTPRDFADGLKMTMLPSLFGAFVFLLTRFSTIVLNFFRPLSKREI